MTLPVATNPRLVFAHLPLTHVPAVVVSVHGHVHNNEPVRPGRYVNICVEPNQDRPLPLQAVVRLAADPHWWILPDWPASTDVGSPNRSLRAGRRQSILRRRCRGLLCDAKIRRPLVHEPPPTFEQVRPRVGQTRATDPVGVELRARLLGEGIEAEVVEDMTPSSLERVTCARPQVRGHPIDGCHARRRRLPIAMGSSVRGGIAHVVPARNSTTCRWPSARRRFCGLS